MRNSPPVTRMSGKVMVKRGVLADLGEDVELLDDRLALELHAEDALAGCAVGRLDEPQTYRVLAVGHGEAIALHAVSGRFDRAGGLRCRSSCC